MEIKIDKLPKTELSTEMTDIEEKKEILKNTKNLYEYIDNLIIQIIKANKKYIHVIDYREGK